MIVSIDKNQLPEYLDIIHKSFATVANEFGVKLGIIEENTVLKNWYSSNGFVHKGTQSLIIYHLRGVLWNGIVN